MKVSLSIIKSLIGHDLPPVNELVQRINERLGSVEGVIDIGAKYKDAKIVRVVRCEKHPDADKLSLCQIDAGTGELVQVVCGANNVHAGMWAVWLPPESTVPSTFDEKEPFVLGARELRGKMSNGMLASARELGIGDDHDGIVDIAPLDLPEGRSLQVGGSFAEVFGLDDTIIDIENKMLTHRPDLFGHIGLAREISGILHKKFFEKDWYVAKPQFEGTSELPLDVTNSTPDNAARFMAVAMKNVRVGQSPLWLRCALVAMGAKPISNIVDMTNYLMLMTAQPVHAYDYDKLRGQKLGVRMAGEGETIRLLNDKVYELDVDDIVIVDGEGPVGLAGVMGGLDSEVSESTQNIVLEVANFDMYAIRKTSMRHGLFTDAVTRFNKGQSPWQNPPVLAELMRMVGQVAGGEVASGVFDASTATDEGARTRQTQIFSIEKVNEVLGADLSSTVIAQLLDNVNLPLLDIGAYGEHFALKVPFWRMDVEQPEDVVEEVGRLYGFDNVPRSLPMRHMKPAPKNPVRETKKVIRKCLASAGANEVLTYSFVHENVLKRSEQDASQAFRLSNALSPDLQYYRLTVLPSLLDKVRANIKTGHDEFILFEMGKGHNKKYHANDDEGLPGELNFLDAVYSSKKPKDGAAYYHARRLLDNLASDLKCELVYKQVTEQLDYPVTAPFDLERSALVETTDGVFVGMIGELKQSVVASFKLPEYTAAATLDMNGLVGVYSKRANSYNPLSRYPSVSQDVSIKAPNSQTYSEVFNSVSATALQSDIDVVVQPVSIYTPESSADTKTLTFRLTFTSHSRTLSDKDIAPIIAKLEQLSL